MGTKNKVTIIAECGHNANGSMRHMKLQIEEAKKCGADIAKFQVYDIDKIMTPDNSVYMELKMSQLEFEEVEELKRHCDKIGIEFMASAFDAERVGWLEEVGVKRHKLASRSIHDYELYRAMLKTDKPIIASLGMVEEGKEIFVDKGNQSLLLYCKADYPATITEEEFPKSFRNPKDATKLEGKYIGFSDHTIGIEWAKEAVRRGATIIEKHFTLDKRLPGCDQAGSADPREFKELVDFAREYERTI